MKNWLSLLFFLGYSLAANAQFTSATGTVSDSAGTTYASATVSCTIGGGSSGAAPTINGSAVPSPVTGTADGSGVVTLSLADNSQVKPTQTSWSCKVIAAVGAPQFVANFNVSGASGTLPFAGKMPPPSSLGYVPFAGAPSGACYFLQNAVNTSSGAFYTCNATSPSTTGTWVAAGGSGTGTVTSSGTPLIHQMPIWTTATNLIGLANGTTGQFLGANTGADPSWQTPSGSGTVTSVTSANTDIGVATTTTTPVLTFNRSLTLTAPNIGAATGTSLLATGIVDGQAPITITTGTTANLGATYNSGYTLNQEATAGTGVTYTLPATATGKQYCVANSGTTGVVNTGVLTVYPAASSFVILNGVVNTVGGGGTHGVASGGAAGDAACFVAIDSTHWQVWVGKGTWTEN